MTIYQFHNVGEGYSSFSEVMPTGGTTGGLVGTPFTGGAPEASYSAPAPVYVPKSLDVVVKEGMLVSNGDAKSSGLQTGDYVDNRGTGTAWDNIQAILSSDDVYATVELSAGVSSQELFVQGFNFNLPPDAELLGLEVEVERSVIRGSVASDTASVGVCEFGQPGVVRTSDEYWTSSDATWSGEYWSSSGGFVSLSELGSWINDTQATHPHIAVTVENTTGSNQHIALKRDSGAYLVLNDPYVPPGISRLATSYVGATSIDRMVFQEFNSLGSFRIHKIQFYETYIALVNDGISIFSNWGLSFE